MIFIFELSDLFELMFFFNLKDGLLASLIEQDIKNGLNLNIVIKQIVVFNLRYLIDTCFLRDIFWSWRFRLENISLQFHFCFIWLNLALFSQEVSEVYLYTGRRPGSQVVGTSGVFRLFEFHELGLDHFDFLLFSFFFNALLFLLRGSQMLLQHILIMGVTSEYSLVVHDVKCLATFLFFWDWRVEHTILGASVFVLIPHYLGLSSFERI
jgi:hypothetical protein